MMMDHSVLKLISSLSLLLLNLLPVDLGLSPLVVAVYIPIPAVDEPIVHFHALIVVVL